MQKTRILKSSIYAALVLCALPVFSTPKITITAPTITFDGNDAALDAQLNEIFQSTEFTDVWDELEASANDQLSSYGSQENLALGFGNANAYAAQSATLQGYQGYKLFSLMGGMMIGAQLPTFDLEEIMKIPEKIEEDPDVYAGVAPSLSFNLGVHVGPIFRIFSKDLGEKMDKFYFNVKYGTYHYVYKIDDEVGDAVFDTTNFGFGVNYQWIPRTPSLMGGLFMWRGINFGSGILYQSNKISFATQYEATQEIPTTSIGDSSYSGTVDANVTVNSKIKLGVTTSTFSIPLEATTSVQVLWLLNFNFGAGVDLVFGNTDITAKAEGDTTIDDIKIIINGVEQTLNSTSDDGNITVDASTEGIAPSFLRPRLMFGLGANLGPLKIDVPVYYYFNTGVAFGVTCGIVW